MIPADTRIEKPTAINILLVEDDDGDAKAVLRGFQKAKMSHPVRRAVDGVAGLEILNGLNGQERLEAPFIVVVDLNMPRMNGLEFVKAIRDDADLRQSIVFMLSTSKSEDDKSAAYQLNVAGYIVKETAGQDFLGLSNLMDGYGRIVEIPRIFRKGPGNAEIP